MAKKNKELEEKRKEYIEKVVNKYPIKEAIKKIQSRLFITESGIKKIIKKP